MTNYEENTGRPTVRETVECESNTIYDGSSDPLGHIFEGIETAFIVKSREGNPAPSNITIKNYKFVNVRFGCLGSAQSTYVGVNSTNIAIQNCTHYIDEGIQWVERSDGKTAPLDGGILIFGNGKIDKVRVQNNSCTGLARVALTGDHCNGWTVEGNSSSGAGDTSIYFTGWGHTAKKNTIVNSAKDGIKTRVNEEYNPLLPKSGGHTITENIVLDFAQPVGFGGGLDWQDPPGWLHQPRDAGAAINIDGKYRGREASLPHPDELAEMGIITVTNNYVKVTKRGMTREDYPNPPTPMVCINYGSKKIVSRSNLIVALKDSDFSHYKIETNDPSSSADDLINEDQRCLLEVVSPNINPGYNPEEAPFAGEPIEPSKIKKSSKTYYEEELVIKT
jgi:hypothetical protein